MSATSALTTPVPTLRHAHLPRAVNPVVHGSTADGLVLVVASGNGRWHPEVSTGRVERGDVLGRVAAGGGRDIEVRSPTDMVVRGLLTRPGQLVTAGVALAWGNLVEPHVAA